MKPEIIPIEESNIEIVADLLYQRSRTLRSYIKHKYSSSNDKRFKGVIAKINDKPVGYCGKSRGQYGKVIPV